MAKARKRFEYTATGVLGDKRETMLDNELLLRSELARTKRRGYTGYSRNTISYGMPNDPQSSYAVRECMIWDDVPDPLMEKSKTARRHKLVKTQPANKYCGVPARPSTPIAEVLQFKFQDDWIKQQQQAARAKLKEEQAKKAVEARRYLCQGKAIRQTLPPGVFRENRTYQLRQCRSAKVTEDKTSSSLWKMPKFLNTQSRLDTFQNEAERNKAYEATCTSENA